MSISDRYIARAINLLRAAEGEANDAAKLLKELISKIAVEIEQKYPGLNRNNITTLTRKIERELETFYLKDFPSHLQEIAAMAIEKEITWNVSVLTGESGTKATIANREAVLKSASRKSYQGHSFNYWMRNEFGSRSPKISSIIRTAFANQTPLGELNRQVRDFSARPISNIRTLTRSFFMHNAIEARDAVFQINPEIIEGVIWSSVLDHRTTPLICGVRDGKLYDTKRRPIDHSLPWGMGPGRIHWNCRSISIPKLVGVPFQGTRYATEAGSDYVRGDNVTASGRVRKDTKSNRNNGIFSNAEYTTRTEYEGWLRAQSRTSIDYVSDILGSKEKARMFRDGELSLFQLGLESPVARPINVRQL